MNILEKLKENKYKYFKIGETIELEIVDEKYFERAQDGFRTNQVKLWSEIVGKSFYVIGFESLLGDPILVDTSNEKLPVYFMFHDDWSNIEKVADSFDEFIFNLKAIDKMINVDHSSRTTIREFVISLSGNKEEGFYEAICIDVLDESGFYYDEFED